MVQTRSFTSLSMYLVLSIYCLVASLPSTALPLYACCFSAFLKLVNNQRIGQKITPQKSMPSHLPRFQFFGCLNSTKYLAINNPRCVKKKPLNESFNLQMPVSQHRIIRERSKGRLSKQGCFGQITSSLWHPFTHSFVCIRRTWGK